MTDLTGGAVDGVLPIGADAGPIIDLRRVAGQDTGDRAANARSSAATRTTIWDYRSLIWNFALRDLKARYKGTAMGWAWSLVVPVSMVLIYTFVFAIIFRATPPDFGSGRSGIFAVWLVVGLVPWGLLSNSINGGMPSLLGAGPLLQKIYIPSFVPVLGAVTGIVVQSLIEFGIVLLILAALWNIGWTWLLLPVWMALFITFAAAITYSLSVCNVYFRDLGQIVAILLQLLFFATPIIYPLTMIPATTGSVPLQSLIAANPVTGFVVGFRQLAYEHTLPGPGQTAYAVAWTAALVGLAYLVYRWRGRDVGEQL